LPVNFFDIGINQLHRFRERRFRVADFGSLVAIKNIGFGRLIKIHEHQHFFHQILNLFDVGNIVRLVFFVDKLNNF